MPALRTLLPYSSTPKSDRRSVQADVSLVDKRTVLSALGGDDCILSLVIQSAFHHTATFIRDNDLNIPSPANYARVVSFIRNGAPARAVGHADVVDVTRADQGGEPTSETTPSEPTSPSESSARRERLKAREDKIRRAAGGH